MKPNYEIIIDNMKWTMERVVTEFGICDTFNSAWAPYFNPTFYLQNITTNNAQSLFEISYFDLNVYALLNDLMGSTVIGNSFLFK